MDVLQEVRDISKKSFLSHVYSTTEEGKAEILNVVQYATLGIIPVILLNKFVQRFIPEADGEKSSVELLIEIFEDSLRVDFLLLDFLLEAPPVKLASSSSSS